MHTCYQTPAGNFRYMYDWVAGEWIEGDSRVRQAGSLWGVALINRYRPTEQTQAVLEKGLRFWFNQTVAAPSNGLTVAYQGDRVTSTGTVALVALAIIEYLRTTQAIDEGFSRTLRGNLEGYLRYLAWMQHESGRFSDGYHLISRSRSENSSPYFDGETLLCLTKAARHLGYQHLVPVIQKAIRAMAETYTVDAWRRNPDSRQTKGFYQWGSMAFAEYYQARWQGYELYGDVTLALAWWMIHTHETLSRRRNHAYALEGLISAYTIAKHRNDEAALTGLLFVIDQSLDKLTRWQVGGPLAEQNAFLAANPTEDPMALGGVMNAAGPDPRGKRRASDTQHELRIDVTQHQMHAVMLALEHVYQDSKPAMEQR